MGTLKELAVLATGTILAAGALSACTYQGPPGANDAPGTQGPTISPSAAPTRSTKENWLEDQRANLDTTRPMAHVETAESGTGARTFAIPALTEGRTTLGISLSCNGEGPWRVTLPGNSPGFASSTCSTGDIIGATFPLESPGEPQELQLTLDDDATYWITIFSVASD